MIVLTLLSIDSLRLTLIESDSGTKSERSKSYDEGLDNYREEGTGYVHAHEHPDFQTVEPVFQLFPC